MKYNKDKSKIMFHTKIKRHSKFETWKGMKLVKDCKTLGYTLDAHTNNLEHM